jgi:alkyldihydroxyacetonephosphate synthase
MTQAMNTPGNNGPKRKFWGWGLADQKVGDQEQAFLREAVGGRYAGASLKHHEPPRVSEIELRDPRLRVPESLKHILTVDPEERLIHAYGKSFADCARMFMRHVPHPPDLVAYPTCEQDVHDLMDWAETAGAAAIPFGGGSSVCGGVEPDVGSDYRGTISIDMMKLGKILEVDKTSRAARIEAGIYGPSLEAGLKPHGLTLRHFPQSFEYSTLGGWIATRGGGHYASLYTHIDDFVEATRTVTPYGLLETRRLPGSGAGPSADRMIIGSEGTLGIITEAWMRLQDRPTFRASAAVHFSTLKKGAAAVQALSQSGLYPTNCRLIDASEAASSGAGDGSSALLVLGFESADHPLEAWMARALELVRDHGGVFDQDAVNRSMAPRDPNAESAEHRTGAAGEWRNAFIRAPFYREVLVALGIIVDTFETAITWDKFDEFYKGITEGMQDVLKRVTGREGSVTCRFTHIYPDGPAPYFTFQALGAEEGNLALMLDRWIEIKNAANELVTSLGGTVTHHHSVGRDHRPGYENQTSELFRETLAAAKHRLDPDGIMNPGVLIDPIGRMVGQRGVLGPS